MSSTFIGCSLRLSIFGQSHSEAIGMTLDGLPAGIPVDRDALQTFLNRRAPGQAKWSTPRREEDRPEFLCGLKDDRTCGAPLTAVIHNTNTRSADYSQLKVLPRPGHADYTAERKYGGCQDYSGGGHFSGRLTAPLCIAGGILLQDLERHGITVDARICSVADIRDESPFLSPVKDKAFPVSDDDAGERMQQAIEEARAEGDSVGGVVECIIRGLPCGVGEPIFDGLENQIARLIFAVPAVKGIEFGAGFSSCEKRGSENNDPFCVRNGRVETTTAAGFSAGFQTGCRCFSAPRLNRRLRLQSRSRASIFRRWKRKPCVLPAAMIRASSHGRFLLSRQPQQWQSMI